MPIRMACPCGQKLQVKDEHAGKVIKCPACGTALRIPDARVATASSPSPQQQQVRPKPIKQPAPTAPRQTPAAPPAVQRRGLIVRPPLQIGFDGTGGNFFAAIIGHLLLTFLTLGVYAPWMLCQVANWYCKNLKMFDAKNQQYSFRFDGAGLNLLLTMLGGYLLSIVTLGIYFPWFFVSLTKFFVDNTSIKTPQGEQLKLEFEGGGGTLFGRLIVGYVLTLVTLGIYFPWFVASLYDFYAENTTVRMNKQKLLDIRYVGTGGKLFLPCIGGLFLSLITVGIYYPWFLASLHKKLLEDTKIEMKNGTVMRLNFFGSGGSLFLILLSYILVLFTLGIFAFWYTANWMRYWTANTSIEAA